MPKQPFLPGADADKQTWLNNFVDKLMNAANGYATKYSIPAATITLLDNGRKWVNATMADLSAVRTGSQALTAFKDQLFTGSGPITTPAAPIFATAPAVPVFAGVFTLATSTGAAMKAQPYYSVTDGQDLGLEGAVVATPAAPLPPVLKLVSSILGSVTISFHKDSHDAAKFQGRAAGTLAWADLGTFMASPFHDIRPLAAPAIPEVREFRACFSDKDVPSNAWSDILSATVTP